jgi:hypothetical protein
MPGKVNPVIAELVIQCSYQVMGHDTVISVAAQAGQLELNAFEPVIAYNFFQALKILKNSIPIFAEKCVSGIEPNLDGVDVVHRSVGLVTALNPIIGYKAASSIAKKALATGRPVRELVLEAKLMNADELDSALSPEGMTSPGIPGVHNRLPTNPINANGNMNGSIETNATVTDAEAIPKERRRLGPQHATPVRRAGTAARTLFDGSTRQVVLFRYV